MSEIKNIKKVDPIKELKCAHCFIKIELHNPERDHFCFCSDKCRREGRFFPTEELMIARKKNAEWRKNNIEKVRAYARKSYHKRKKLTGLPVGRPRKIQTEDR